jgi:glutamate-ammonia-ligase adenylyltransferase
LQTANAHARLRILSAYLEWDSKAADTGAAMPDSALDHRKSLSDLADAAVDACARHAWRSLAPRYGLPQGAPDGKDGELAGFAVLALGKLGSKEMRFGSDLDLVFVFRGEGTTAKGRTHLEFYTKLAQKLTALLSAPTQFGVLLELDHRLRPFGRKGLLVPSLAAYESFLTQEAEVWNFQAFTRARHLCGERDLSRAVLDRVARAWIGRRTPPREVAREVLDMARRLMAQSPPSALDRLQLKYSLGGMLGFEFLRQCHFLLACQGQETGAPSSQDDVTRWAPPPDHERVAALSTDYETLCAVDERASFYVEPFRHEVGEDTFQRFAGVRRRWAYAQVRELCVRMQSGVEESFRHLGA